MGTVLEPDVLRAARAGSGSGVEQVFTALGPEVHGYLRAQRAADAEAMTNTTFVEVTRRLPDFDGDGDAFRGWVFGVAHGLLVEERAAADPTDKDPPAGGDVEMLAALDAITQDQRDVLLLHYVADLPLEQVAEATGRSLKAVKRLHQRALEGLRRHLGPAA